MSVLNLIKKQIASSVKVEVKPPVQRNGKTRLPILVTDVSQSFTSGWFVQYNPSPVDNGTGLYDGSETFSELHISRFSQLKGLIETANHYFNQGLQVEEIAKGRKRAIYEPNAAIRLTVTSQKNSNSVTVTITDENSPFHMMSIPFVVTMDNSGSGAYYVVGTDNERWDRNTDVFKEFNANFAPRKGRFYRVQQTQNQPATLRAKIAVVNGQYAINPDGTFQVDTNQVSPEYIQVITNQYKALAYIYEQAIMDHAFEVAIAQGLPVQQAPMQNMANNFAPAFAIPGVGAPNPAMQQQMQQTVPPTMQPSFPLGQQTPAPQQQVPLPAGISADQLPFNL